MTLLRTDPNTAPLDPTQTDPLATLRDIHLPQAVSFWPPAPGWWFLAGAVLLALALLAFLEWRRRQTLGYRALRELDAIAGDGARYGDARAVAAAASVLIRRIVLTRADRAEAATFTGDAWQTFLSGGKAGFPAEIGRFIAVAPYLPPAGQGAAGMDRAQLVAAIRRWIRGNA